MPKEKDKAIPPKSTKKKTTTTARASEKLLNPSPRKAGGGDLRNVHQGSTNPGDNEKYLTATMELVNLGRVDLNNFEAVQDRITKFYQVHINLDLKPTVMGLALALDLDRRRLWEIANDVKGRNTAFVNKDSRDLVKKAYRSLENLWQFYMLNGKINPAAGIFLGKNLYGYKNEVEHVVATPNAEDRQGNVQMIQERYGISTEGKIAEEDAVPEED